jgi:hypothetical protein
MKHCHPVIVSPHGARMTFESFLNVAARDAHSAGE